ncbi:NAD(P)-binding protein [Lentithecium fluviatile CBS 122367]|uniref:NAD(P)-binding protein n=1 Tax=Lentithecium fluviatile CBS 122367 TaxID=1168545 RepID=A0A6G1IS68_9PLEO|nr:NAD(P)-binding protein [Lentithecium fluviatile CBS 122367]
MALSANPPSAPTPSLDGKTAIITGGSSGFGLACAKILPTLGLSHLILGVRSVERCEEEAAFIRKANSHTKVDVWELDMLDYCSVRAFATRCETLPRLDMAVLNAGVNKLEFKRSPATGHEEVLQVNYLSTALLAILLVPLLATTRPQDSPGRLTIVGSAMGLHAKFPERNSVSLLPALDAEWKGVSAASERYSVSKTLVFMLVLKLSQLVKAEHVVVNTVDPGFSASTSFSRDVTGALRLVLGALHAVMGRTAEQGAWTYLDATAVKGKETHGSFLANWEIYPFHAMMYTEGGKRTMEQLWNETIADQEAYGVREVLAAFRR